MLRPLIHAEERGVRVAIAFQLSQLLRRCFAIDALHRQIGNHQPKRLLKRRNEQTPHEGSRRASAWHGMPNRRAECTSRADWLLHSAKRDEKSCSRSAAATPSVGAHEQPLQRHRSDVGGRAWRRVLCVRCTQLVPQTSLRVGRGACKHGMLTHHTALTCVVASCARRRWKGSGAHTEWMSMTGQVVARCYSS